MSKNREAVIKMNGVLQTDPLVARTKPQAKFSNDVKIPKQISSSVKMIFSLFYPTLLVLAEIKAGNTRIMVRNLPVKRRPSIYVYMLKLRLLCQSRTDKHVIQLLTVHVKEVTVPLELWNLGYHVEILQFGNFGE